MRTREEIHSIKARNDKECHFIYKYVENDEIIYIGKTDADLFNRVRCHACERKFVNHIDNSKIYIAEFANKAETYAMELLLINKYKPKLNSAFKYESISNISFEEPKWEEFVEERRLVSNYEGGSPIEPWEGSLHFLKNGDRITFCDCCGQPTIGKYSLGIDYHLNSKKGSWTFARMSLCNDCYGKYLTPVEKALDTAEEMIAKNRNPNRFAIIGEYLGGIYKEYAEQIQGSSQEGVRNDD